MAANNNDAARAEVTRAVGSVEAACREAGNCLERGEWDGAVGWNWGGKDRCDPTDPRCGGDGKLKEGDLVGKPVPQPPPGQERPQITHVAFIEVAIGRDEVGVLKLGLYGQDAPASVDQLISFLSASGLSTIDPNEDQLFGKILSPVSLARGGVVDLIVPGLTVDLGVPSQAYAYARSKGLSKAGDSFVAQPRPKVNAGGKAPISADKFPRAHDAAGLLSVPAKGLGYGGSGFEPDDEAYESSFLITASAVPSFDNAKGGAGARRVVGQVLDATSMAFLERLSNLPTKRGLKGVIPGQTAGPPLLRVSVQNVAVSKVSAPP